ncbi:hypothetical protein U1Q18_049691, partial [Sarracenia purpurea var. burkii]
DLCEDDMLALEKGNEDSFIKENLESNQEETSNSQHNATQPFPYADDIRTMKARNPPEGDE